MKATGIARIVAFNAQVFSRFAGIEAVHPEQIAEVAGARNLTERQIIGSG